LAKNFRIEGFAEDECAGGYPKKMSHFLACWLLESLSRRALIRCRANLKEGRMFETMSVIDTKSMIVRDPLLDGFTYDELKLGSTAYYSKTITEHDVYAFAGVSGDVNPAHVNETGALGMELPGRIAHGALTAGLVSTALGTKMPGQGCLYLSQSSKFIRMVRFGDTITVRLEVTARDDVKKRVTIKTEVFNQNDELVLAGEAKMLPKQ
jgi:3-hydroxybutyryl-CoA dehydratase